MSLVGVTSNAGLSKSQRRGSRMRREGWSNEAPTHALPAMVMRPTADSGFESVLAVKTVETA